MKAMIFLLLLLAPTIILASPLEVGDSLPTLTLKDQHDEPRSVSPATRVMLFSASRIAADLVEQSLAGQTAERLAAAGIVYVADIDGMPPMVFKLVALPQMRKLPYPMLLGRQSAETAMLPRAPDQVTLIEAKDGKVTAMRFVDDPLVIEQTLNALLE
jgi:hypothetical protein